MRGHNPVFYHLGSRQRWIESLLLLFAPFLIAQISILLVVHRYHQNWTLAVLTAFALSIPLFTGVIAQTFFSTQTDKHAPLLSNSVLNLAYGRAEENGIYYREWFRHRFVSWKGVARLEFWPESDNRVVLHLYSQHSPVVFIPDSSRGNLSDQDQSHAPSAVDFISQKLNETWPGKAPFLICFESPKTYRGINGLLGKLNVRQRAVANASITLLLLFAYSTYGVLVSWETHLIINYAFLAFMFLLVIWLRITGQPKVGVSSDGTQKSSLSPRN